MKANGDSALKLNAPAGVEWVRSDEPAEWAVARMCPASPGRWRLSTFMPDGFAAYARVFHRLADRGGEVRTKRWADLAAERGVPFRPDISLREILGDEALSQGWLDEWAPLGGNLSPLSLSALVAVLGGWTETADRCWFCVWDGYGGWWPPITASLEEYRSAGAARTAGFRKTWAQRRRIDQALTGVSLVERPARRYFLFRGPIGRANAFLEDQAANLWWPEDRRWFVSTEVDAYSTYVGGSQGCINALIHHTDLEVVSVALDTMLDPGPY